MGGEEQDAQFFGACFLVYNLTRDTIERAFLVRGYPLTPRGPLLPTNSGSACLRWMIRSSEFAGRGGAIVFFC